MSSGMLWQADVCWEVCLKTVLEISYLIIIDTEGPTNQQAPDCSEQYVVGWHP